MIHNQNIKEMKKQKESKVDHVRMLFGKRMKEVRLSKPWYLKQLSDVCGIAETELSKIELGKKCVTNVTEAIIIIALGMKHEDFFATEAFRNLAEAFKELA